MLGRRFLILVAVLMGLTALAASIAPREPLIRERSRPTPTPTPTAEANAVRTVEKTVAADAGHARVVVREGDLVRLTVDASAVDTVTVMDQFRPVEADSPAVFELLADTPGEFPITLLDADRRVGTLVVRAAAGAGS
jgi:hypothetical protein